MLDFMIKNNFRPISNLAFSGKLIKYIVADQIISYIDQHSLMEEKQSAYRKFHSTETALFKVKTNIIRAMNNQEITWLILLDLSAAFDTIDHTILLNRLETTFGIKDTALKLITSFLNGRTQKVAIGDLGTDHGATSDPVTLTLVYPGVHMTKGQSDLKADQMPSWPEVVLPGFVQLLEIRKNYEMFFQSGKSQGI